MRRYLVLLGGLAATALASAGDNLLPNGNFDAGTAAPLHWEAANRLTSFFVQEEGRGRVVRLDSRIEKVQAREFAAAFRADPSLAPPAPHLLPVGDYGSIGAFDGVALDSDPIEVQAGQNYRLTADLRGPGGGVIVWIKGFMDYHGRWRDGYQTRLAPERLAPDRWGRFSILFNPTAKTPRVTRIKVRLYAYWPSGEYYFDNVRLEAIGEAEAKPLLAAREETGAKVETIADLPVPAGAVRPEAPAQ